MGKLEWAACLAALLVGASCGPIEKTALPDGGDGDSDSDTDSDTDTDTDPDAGATCDPGWAGPDCGVCVRFVDVTAAAGGDGLTWTTAVTGIQDAIESARSEVLDNDEVDACEVWVARGIYYVYKAGDDDAIRLREGVEVYGGFSGDFTEGLREERDFENNVTVIDGHEGVGEELDVFHAVIGADHAVLDGFTVTGGCADGDADDSGGGMLNLASAPTVRNVVFAGNRAEAAGGAMWNADGAAPMICDCAFIDNSAQLGGGIGNSDSSPAIIGCRIEANTASDRGGGIHGADGSAVLVQNSVLLGNHATLDGGAFKISASTLTLENSTLTGNAGGGSDGLSLDGGSAATVVNSILWGNGTKEIATTSSTIGVTFSDVQGGFSGAGNIDDDPLFEDGANGDLRPGAGSPCIDAANGDEALAVDIEGYPRVDDPGTANTGAGSPPYSDIGAHEYQP